MTALRGKYHNGKLSLEAPFESEQPVDVIVTFLEEGLNANPQRPLQISDFSFAKTRALLKDLNESLSDEVIQERRSAL